MSKATDAVDEWAAFYATLPKELGKKEKTVTMLANELGVSTRTAHLYIKRGVKEGFLEYVGERKAAHGMICPAWRAIPHVIPQEGE